MSTRMKLVRPYGLLVLLLVGAWSLSVFSLPSAHATPQTPADEQIVGGRDANRAEFPWQVYLEVARSSFCGGSLINDEWVVTAAHCVRFSGETQTEVLLVLGEHQLSQAEAGEELRQASQVIPHPDYDEQTGDNDIALIQLNAPVAFSQYIQAIDLINSPADDSLVTVGTAARVSGWGLLQEGGDMPDILQMVEVPLVANATCNTAYGGGITANMLCAGNKSGGKDSCQGDSGGPLVVPDGDGWQQAGIVSFGDGCARPNRYGVYTRISRYSNWINSTIGGTPATSTPTPSATTTPSATPTATATATPIPSPTPTLSATAPPNANYVHNGDFEAGPNGEWAESSNHFGGLGSLIVQQPSVAPPITPLGLYAARLGGLDAEQATLSQNVTLPQGGSAQLHFSYRLLSQENQCGDDQVLLQVNSTTLAVFNLCQANQNLDWQGSTHDLSAYLDKSFKLQLSTSSDDQLISHFVLDEVSLTVDNAVVAPTPTTTATPAAQAGGVPLYLPLIGR